MTAIATILPPDVHVVQSATQVAPSIERLYVYGDGALWLLDGPAMRLVADGKVRNWLDVAEDTGARSTGNGRWVKRPALIYVSMSGKPASVSNADRVVSYDEDIPAMCRELAPAEGTPEASLSAADWKKLAHPKLANLLAYVGLTGSMPKGLHQSTWSRLYQLTPLSKRETRVYDLHPHGEAIAIGSPLGLTLSALKASGYRWGGWGAGRYGNRAKFLELRKERDDGSSLTCTVWWHTASGTPYWSFELHDVHGRIPRGPDGKKQARPGEAVAMPVRVPEDWR